MIRRVDIKLRSPANDMAREEVLKQLVFLSRQITNPEFSDDGRVLRFDAPEESAADLSSRAEKLSASVQRGLRSLQRKVYYRSLAADKPEFRGTGEAAGITMLGPGQAALAGLPLRLFRYFDRVFEQFGRSWNAEPLITPTLIPASVLAKCDYFRSFPNNVTFACHLSEDADQIASFRARHQERNSLDDRAVSDLATPEAGLSPAVCYHVYHLHQGQEIPAAGLVHSVCGKCFRYESSNMASLRRLWDFTLREVVFMGDRQGVLRHRDRSIELMSHFMEENHLAGEIRTASDPFFIAPDAVAKTYYQLSSESKLEISLMLPDGSRLAVGSHNYHTDFFGRAFNVTVEGAGLMHSVCVGFGLERWVYAFLGQHGDRTEHWPAVVRNAPEFTGGGH
jgi:seryl-tRNA synthetase